MDGAALFVQTQARMPGFFANHDHSNGRPSTQG